jgi:hypothetical protein
MPLQPLPRSHDLTAAFSRKAQCALCETNPLRLCAPPERFRTGLAGSDSDGRPTGRGSNPGSARSPGRPGTAGAQDSQSRTRRRVLLFSGWHAPHRQCQARSHMRVDVQAIGCDFYVFSGHKAFAPIGLGVIYGKSEVLDRMPPWQGGGNMIQDVIFEKTLYQPPPQRFEAGTEILLMPLAWAQPSIIWIASESQTSRATSTHCSPMRPNCCNAFPDCAPSARQKRRLAFSPS